VWGPAGLRATTRNGKKQSVWRQWWTSDRPATAFDWAASKWRREALPRVGYACVLYWMSLRKRPATAYDWVAAGVVAWCSRAGHPPSPSTSYCTAVWLCACQWCLDTKHIGLTPLSACRVFPSHWTCIVARCGLPEQDILVAWGRVLQGAGTASRLIGIAPDEQCKTQPGRMHASINCPMQLLPLLSSVAAINASLSTFTATHPSTSASRTAPRHSAALWWPVASGDPSRGLFTNENAAGPLPPLPQSLRPL